MIIDVTVDLLCFDWTQVGAGVLEAAIVRPSDTSKPRFLPEDSVLGIKQSSNLTHCRDAPGRFSQCEWSMTGSGACSCQCVPVCLSGAVSLSMRMMTAG